MLEEFGKLGNDIREEIRSTAQLIVNENLEPIRVLKEYENVDVLTFEEACKVLRLNETELKNAIANELIPFLRLGQGKIIYRFPKRLLVDYLLGQWRKGEVKPLRSVSNFEDKVSDFVS